MKILALSGGMKDGVNDAMAKQALMGAKELGAEVEFIRLLDLNLKPCTGCVHCVIGKNNGVMIGGAGKCAIKNDDFYWLVEKLYEADAFIFAMPIFIKGLTSAFQVLAHRFGGPGYDPGLMELGLEYRREHGITDDDYPGPDLRALKKRFALYISVGGSDWTKRAAADYGMFSLISKIVPVDNIVLSWGKSSIMDDERLRRVYDAGKALVETVRDPDNASYRGDAGFCPNCHSRLMYFNEDGKTASCLICDARGDIVKDEDGTMRFVFPQSEYARMHDTKAGKLLHQQEMQEIEGKNMGFRTTEKYLQRVQGYKDFITATKPVRQLGEIRSQGAEDACSLLKETQSK